MSICTFKTTIECEKTELEGSLFLMWANPLISYKIIYLIIIK